MIRRPFRSTADARGNKKGNNIITRVFLSTPCN
jgi:hypothetical protein